MTDATRADRVQRACLFGSGWACGTYAATQAASGDATKATSLQVSRLYPKDCMPGEPADHDICTPNYGRCSRFISLVEAKADERRTIDPTTAFY